MKFRHFVVYGSSPEFNSRNGYRSNQRIGVIAVDIEEAIRLAKARYPDLSIYDVSHQGIVEVISEDARVLMEPPS